MSGATTVTITIRGRLSERLVAAFDGMSAVAGPSCTELVGRVADQAQLHGLLARVRDLGLELESVSVGETPRHRSRVATARRVSSDMTRPVDTDIAGPAMSRRAPDR